MNDAPPFSRPDLAGLWLRLRLLREAGGAVAAPQDGAAWSARLLSPRWFAHWRLPACVDDVRPLPLHQLTSDELACLAQQVAHVGVMQIDAYPEGELCSWLRRADYQPPGVLLESGWLMFEAQDRLVEVHVHDDDSSVWSVDTLCGADVAFCLAGLDANGLEDGRLLIGAGAYLAYHRPRRVRWPRGMQPGFSLVDVLLHRPDEAHVWLDHELSLARRTAGRFEVVRSTLPEQRGRVEMFSALRQQPELAWVSWRDQEGPWRVLDWHGPDAV